MEKAPDLMSYTELVSYMAGYTRRLSDIEAENNDEAWFFALQARLYKELANGLVPIYKVSNVDATRSHNGGLTEYQTKYYYSLNAAKHELKQRYRRLRKSHMVASPDEVQMVGADYGIRPDLLQSVITNKDMRTRPPGRFKIYEIRMKEDDNIIPIQLILSRVAVAPAKKPSVNKRKTKGISIPFPGTGII